MKTTSKTGFTLIELLVVIAIIGLLSSVVLASLSGARESAKITRAISDLRQIETGMTLWMQATRQSQWPASSNFESYREGTQAVTIRTLMENTQLSEYLTIEPSNPFNDNGYYYDLGTGDSAVFTCGADPAYHGAVIILPAGLTAEQKEQLDQIIDGGQEVDFQCGVFRSREGDGGHSYYSLSDSGRL